MTCRIDGICHTDAAASCTTDAGYAGSCSTGTCVVCAASRSCSVVAALWWRWITLHVGLAAQPALAPCTLAHRIRCWPAVQATGCNAPNAAQTGSACNDCHTCLASGTCQAINLVANGGFEAGFDSFTVLTTDDDDGNWYIQTGTASPVTGFVAPAPPQGLFAAMTDQRAPGARILYFQHTVNRTDEVLSFRYYVYNRGRIFFPPDSFLYYFTSNQQALVYISAKPPSLDTYPAKADIIFRTENGSPANTSVYAQLSTSLAAYHQQTIYVAFGEVDHRDYFNFGIDDIQITCGAPVTE